MVDPEGYVVTNNHVIAEADEIQVVFNDETTYDATLVGRDTKTDLALLKIEADHPLVAVTFADSDAVRVGDWIIAIGNPFGLGSTVTAGIVSARSRDIGPDPTTTSCRWMRRSTAAIPVVRASTSTAP